MNEIKEKIKDLELALNYVCYDADLIPKLQTVWQKLELLQEVVNKNALLADVSGCLSQQDAKVFYDCMLKWEQNDLIDYSLMKGADYMQRTLAKILGIDYKPK